MRKEYEAIVKLALNRHKDVIAEADENPDKWYELFVSEGDAGTHTVESADTFDEIVLHLESRAEQYGFENINIDIWENREHPNNLNGLFDTQTRPEAETPILIDGAAYTIYLKNSRKIYNAIYHHCTLSGKHYFAKGDDVYPIEDVYSHGIKEFIRQTEPPQTIAETYYGHKLVVTFDRVTPYCKITSLPDSVKEIIFDTLAEDSLCGSFTEEETGDTMDDEYCAFSGSWSIVELDYELLFRIGSWNYNRHQDESLTQELFEENFGKVQGAHYYSKWIDYYKQHLINMVGYLSSNPVEAQTFCNMVIQKIKQYEQRKSIKNH